MIKIISFKKILQNKELSNALMNLTNPGKNKSLFRLFLNQEQWAMSNTVIDKAVICYEDSKPVGWALAWIKNNQHFIGTYVHPDYRHKGIGMKVVKRLRKAYPVEIQWVVSPFSDEGESFYAKLEML